MLAMNVAALAVDRSSGQPIVILSDAAQLRMLPIWIGVPEAAAISKALTHTPAERPQTCDLMHRLIDELGYRVVQVSIDELRSQTYYATIELAPKNDPETTIRIDARPSDAIALATIADAPILVSLQVVAEATVPADSERERTQSETFKQFIAGVKASDFASALGSRPGTEPLIPDDDDDSGADDLDDAGHGALSPDKPGGDPPGSALV